MLRSSFISKSDGIKMLSQFLQCQCEWDRLFEAIVTWKYERQRVIEYVAGKIKEIMLDLESELFNCGKITALKLYDYSSDRLFEHLLCMNKYFPERLHFDFVFEQRCKYEKVERSSTKVKMEMYQIILSYAQQNDLLTYQFAPDCNFNRQGPFLNPLDLFSAHQLEQICFHYEMSDGSYDRIEEHFRQTGIRNPVVPAEQLRQGIKNLELIGLYRCLRESAQSQGHKGDSWEKFVANWDDHLATIQDWEGCLKTILIRLAVRAQANDQHIRIVSSKLNKRYIDKVKSSTKQPLPPPDRPEYNDLQIIKMRKELHQILQGKIWFSGNQSTN